MALPCTRGELLRLASWTDTTMMDSFLVEALGMGIMAECRSGLKQLVNTTNRRRFARP